MTVMEGSLSKWTNVMKGWQYRWFVLDDNAGLLSYYTSKEKMMRGVRRGCVRLKGAVIGIDDEDDSTFTITVDHKTFHFQGRDAEEREQWVRALEDTIMRHATMRSRWDQNRTPPTLKDFDNKVSEADAYLQIMIDQTKDLENTIHEIKDKEEQDKCRIILSHANTMLDNIKHTIVLLQIAKNTAHPVNGIYQGPTSLVSSGSVSSVICTGLPSRPISSEQGIEVGADCLENARRQSRALSEDYRKLSAGRPITLAVPETSYSSSEGEDDFFDANDSPFTPGSHVSSPVSTRSQQIDEDDQGTSEPLSESDRKKSVAYNENNLIKKDGTIDYDALYEDNMEDDGCNLMQESVISHLISQIKIGMDLTKVVLPTFILERRSLLEMYADYLAHPDMFVKIAELKDPRERMVQVVKWYLSSYHAGRKSSVAKKPYNPILGEVFRCHWDLPSEDNNTSENPEQQTDDCVTDGPIPWCTKNQLTFVAEQVSHHPPISAFYGEHFNKGISFSGHVYTKSKFLGLSVCVYNIGQGIVSVLDHNEDYVVTFPIGYGRSILTVPWIELGGNVTITCAKTGYHADINFLTKPFYGTKKHRITCDVFGPNENKPFLKINGEWNGVMEAKWADGTQELFVDVSKLSVVKKIVRPIAQQDDNESRRLWKEVTAGLRFNKIEHATDAKTELEQRQREEARLRKENNVKWETKLFKPAAEAWYYSAPLSHRLTNKNKENGDLVQ